jgi:hypothetical protein
VLKNIGFHWSTLSLIITVNQEIFRTYTWASFLSKLRAKKVEKLHNSSYSFKTNDGLPEILKMKYRNRIQERLFPVLPIVYIKKIMPTDQPLIILTCDSKHTYFCWWLLSVINIFFQFWQRVLTCLYFGVYIFLHTFCTGLTFTR